MSFNPLLQASIRWLAIIAGFISVCLLLMLLAGFFVRKVPSQPVEAPRLAPKDGEIYTVQLVTQTRYENAVGTIKPIHESNIAAKLLAKVQEVNVTAGLKVSAGDVLVRLNDDELIARLRQSEAERDAAQAHLAQAQSDAQRATQLFKRQAISQSEYEANQTAVRTTQAQYERALRAVDETKVFFDYATIRAPFNGIVVDKVVEPGDTVTPGQTLLTLYDPTQMQLVASVRESLAVQLKPGQQVMASLESMDQQCMATIREVVPRADSVSRSFDVKVSGPCPPGVYSGMFGRLHLPLEDEQVLLIPNRAVMRVGQLTFVQVVQSGQLERRFVQLGRSFQDQVEVLSGLAVGDQVLLHQASAQGAERK